MRTFFRNVRYSARSLARSPGFTFAAVLTLALGIGANTAVFSIVDAVVLRPLPYRDSSRLVIVWDQLRKLGLDQFPVSRANYDDYRRENRVFEDIAAFNMSDMSLEGTGDAVPQRLQAMAVSPNLFALLGVSPAAGTPFSPGQSELGHGDAVILSDALWRQRFAGVSSVVGRWIRLDGRSYRVQGVMPPHFAFSLGTAPDLWTPLTRNENPVRVIARLRPAVSLAQAQANLTTIAAGIEATRHPYTGPHREDAGYGVSLVRMRDQLFGGYRTGVLILAGAVFLVLLIACANVANLLLARGVNRERDLAIRAALGASRRQLLSECVAESLVLSLAGASAGAVLAGWGVRALAALSGVPEQAGIAVDLRVLTFTLALSVVTGLLFGLAPGASARKELNLQGGRTVVGRERSPIASVLIAAEVALSVVLLIGAGLLLKSLMHLRSVAPGFDPHNLLTMQVTLPEVRYPDSRTKIAFYDRLSDGLRRIPGVEAAAIVSQLPVAGGTGGDPFSIEGRAYNSSGTVPQVATRYRISPEYFRTMRIPLITGRWIDERDGPSAPRVAVINETMARDFWMGGNPIGRHVVMGAPRAGVPWLTIVGVVADVRGSSLRADPIPQIYTSYSQDAGSGSMFAVMRSARDPMSLALTARRELSAVDRGQSAADIRTMEDRLAGSIRHDRFEAWLLSIFAVAALALAAIGIYGVLANSVSRRVSEIGLRVALGAQSGDVMRLIVVEGMRPASAGLLLGLAATFPLGRLLRNILFQVTPADPMILATVPLLFALIAVAACVIPARRAILVDPAKALLWQQ